MSWKVVLAIMLMCLLFMGALILFRAKPVSKPLSTSDLLPRQDASEVPVAAAKAAIEMRVPSSAELGHASGQQDAYLAAFLTPISFWGKVVDEKGQPISGATAKLGANSNPNPMGSGTSYERTTDVNGLFSITDAHGIALSVEVSKAGYYSTDESRGTVNYVLNSNTGLPIPSADAPAVFILRTMGHAAPLIRVAPRPVRMPKDGSVVEFSLRRGQLGDSDKLKVECWTQDQHRNAQGKYDWRCRISVPGGGLIERTSPYDFEAPTDGYQPVLEITMSRSAEKWKKGMEKEYFARLPGNLYARFTFRLTTGGEHFFVIESYFNPEPGNRNLEYDSKKRLAPST